MRHALYSERLRGEVAGDSLFLVDRDSGEIYRAIELVCTVDDPTLLVRLARAPILSSVPGSTRPPIADRAVWEALPPEICRALARELPRWLRSY